MGFSLLDTRTQREKFGLESKVLEAILLASMTDGLETQRQTHKKKKAVGSEEEQKSRRLPLIFSPL